MGGELAKMEVEIRHSDKELPIIQMDKVMSIGTNTTSLKIPLRRSSFRESQRVNWKLTPLHEQDTVGQQTGVIDFEKNEKGLEETYVNLELQNLKDRYMYQFELQDSGEARIENKVCKIIVQERSTTTEITETYTETYTEETTTSTTTATVISETTSQRRRK